MILQSNRNRILFFNPNRKYFGTYATNCGDLWMCPFKSLSKRYNDRLMLNIPFIINNLTYIVNYFFKI